MLSTCLYFNTGLKLVWRVFFGKVDLFAPLLEDTEAISVRPHLLEKSSGGQPNNYFFRPWWLIQSCHFVHIHFHYFCMFLPHLHFISTEKDIHCYMLRDSHTSPCYNYCIACTKPLIPTSRHYHGHHEWNK